MPVEWNSDGGVFVCWGRPLPGAPDAKNPYKARVVVNRELFNSSDRSCRHVEFDIKGASIRYVREEPFG